MQGAFCKVFLTSSRSGIVPWLAQEERQIFNKEHYIIGSISLNDLILCSLQQKIHLLVNNSIKPRSSPKSTDIAILCLLFTFRRHVQTHPRETCTRDHHHGTQACHPLRTYPRPSPVPPDESPPSCAWPVQSPRAMPGIHVGIQYPPG